MHIGHHRHPRKKNGLKDHPWSYRGIGALAYFVSFLSLFFTLDQVRLIWLERHAEGVSLISWIFYTTSALVWFLYGIIHKDRALIVTNFFWVAFSLLVVIGILLYQ